MNKLDNQTLQTIKAMLESFYQEELKKVWLAK